MDTERSSFLAFRASPRSQALTYNDRSVLENYHAAASWRWIPAHEVVGRYGSHRVVTVVIVVFLFLCVFIV